MQQIQIHLNSMLKDRPQQLHFQTKPCHYSLHFKEVYMKDQIHIPVAHFFSYLSLDMEINRKEKKKKTTKETPTFYHFREIAVWKLCCCRLRSPTLIFYHWKMSSTCNLTTIHSVRFGLLLTLCWRGQCCCSSV